MRDSTLDLAAQWLIELWWNRLPLLAGRVSRTFSIVLSDGLYLAAWPRVAALAPPISLLVGFLAGWQRLGADQVFTQSMLILSLAVIFGFVSGQLGFMFALGYALADFFLYSHPAFAAGNWVMELQMRVALLITYVALAMSAVVIPLSVRLLRAETPMPPPRLPDLRLVVESVFSGITSAFLLFLYLQAVPLLIRPLFTWRGFMPPVQAVSPIQNLGWVIALIAFVVAVLRVLAEYGAAVKDPEASEVLADRLDSIARPGLLNRLPWVARLALGSGFGTLLFAGLLDSWLNALILFLGILSIGAVRSVLPVWGGAWSQGISRIPMVLRLLLALGVSYFFCFRLLANLQLGGSFQPLVWALLLSMLFVAALLPLSRRK